MSRWLQTLEIPPRLVGMLVALLVIWTGFHIASGGAFLTPRNLWNLSVQTASIAVMACGMVLVIVTRNIDLLTTRNWIDIPVRFASGKRGIIAFEKGLSGEQRIAEGFAAWR
jgi:hypothetical protein